MGWEVMNLTEIKESICRKYDPDAIVDMLGITSEELLDEFEGKLIDKIDEFTEEYEYGDEE